MDSRFGIRLKDSASTNSVVGNLIQWSEVFGVYIYKGSGRNVVTSNTISGGKAGVVINDGIGNRVLRNTIIDVDGHAVSLIGDAHGSIIALNTLAGRGSSAVDVLRVHDANSIRVLGNDAEGWVTVPGFRPVKFARDFLRHHPAIAVWLVFIILLAFVGYPVRRRWVRLTTRPHHYRNARL